MGLAHLARLAFYGVSHHIGPQTGTLRPLRRSFQGLGGSGHHMHLGVFKTNVSELGSLQHLVAQLRQHMGRHGQVQALYQLQRLRAGGGVGHCGATGDGGGVVTGHIADGQGQQLRRYTCLCQPPPFDAREVLAHAVHLANVGATGQ